MDEYKNITLIKSKIYCLPRRTLLLLPKAVVQLCAVGCAVVHSRTWLLPVTPGSGDPDDPPCGFPTLTPSAFALRLVQPNSNHFCSWVTSHPGAHLSTVSSLHITDRASLTTLRCEQLMNQWMDTGIQRLSHIITRCSLNPRGLAWPPGQRPNVYAWCWGPQAHCLA